METYSSIIIQDLLEITNQEIQPVTIPYNLTDSKETQISKTYDCMKRAVRTRQRIRTLTYAYYLGELLENLPNQTQFRSLLRQMTKYYKTASRRIYYIFYSAGINQIWRTKRMTLRMVYKLPAEDYQLIIL